MFHVEHGTRDRICGPSFQRAAERLGVGLSPRALDRFECYGAGIRTWSGRTGLVSRKDLPVLAERHFLECIAVVPFLPEGSFELLDLGSGAGLPGIPIKIMRPEIRVSLLESKRGKALFLTRMKGALNLPDLEVIRGRAEQVCEETRCLEAFRVVTARAVGPLCRLWELACPLMRPDGELIAFKGPGELAASFASLPLGIEGREEILKIPGAKAKRALVFLKGALSGPPDGGQPDRAP